MDPAIYEQIAKKINELKELLDTANAQALSGKEVKGRMLLSAKLNSLSNSILQTLLGKPTLYADRIDRTELADLKRTYDNVPVLIRDLNTCIKKAEGWRISTGQNIAAIMLRLYRLLGADLPDMPDLASLHESLASIFRKGKRKPKGGDNAKPDTDATNDDNATDDNPTPPTT